MNHFTEFSRLILHPVKYRMFLLRSLPAAFFAGIKVETITKETAVATVHYKWINTNPFRSMYFAVLSMAAEMTTGSLCMGHSYKSKPAISMLLVDINGLFHKKATGKIQFTCNDGIKIEQVIQQVIGSNESSTVKCHSIGTNSSGEMVAEFYFTWSFKAKNKL